MTIKYFFIILLIVGCNTKSSITVNEKYGCLDSSACNYDLNATVDNGSCEYISCLNLICDSSVCISIENISEENKNFQVHIINSVSIAGFQLEFSGVNVISAYGGSAVENGFTISTGVNNIVLGFSLGGDIIPVGSSILTNITFSNFVSPLCINAPIFSDSFGNSLSIDYIECYN